MPCTGSLLSRVTLHMLHQYISTELQCCSLKLQVPVDSDKGSPWLVSLSSLHGI